MKSRRPSAFARAPFRSAVARFCALLSRRYLFAGRRRRKAGAPRRVHVALAGGMVWLRWPGGPRAFAAGVVQASSPAHGALPAALSGATPLALRCHEVQQIFTRIRERVSVGHTAPVFGREALPTNRETHARLVLESRIGALSAQFGREHAAAREVTEIRSNAAPHRASPLSVPTAVGATALAIVASSLDHRRRFDAEPSRLPIEARRLAAASSEPVRSGNARAATALSDASVRAVLRAEGWKALPRVASLAISAVRSEEPITPRRHAMAGISGSSLAMTGGRQARPSTDAVSTPLPAGRRNATPDVPTSEFGARVAARGLRSEHGVFSPRVSARQPSGAAVSIESGASHAARRSVDWTARASGATLTVAVGVAAPRVARDALSVAPSTALALVSRPTPRKPSLDALPFVNRREKTIDVREIQEHVTRRLEEQLERRVVQNVQSVVARELSPDSALARRLGDRLYGGLYESLVLEKERMGWG